jgi:hypothetical protein
MVLSDDICNDSTWLSVSVSTHFYTQASTAVCLCSLAGSTETCWKEEMYYIDNWYGKPACTQLLSGRVHVLWVGSLRT